MKCKLCNYEGDNFYPSNKSTCKRCVAAAAKQRYHSLSESDKQAHKTRSKLWQDKNIFAYRLKCAKQRSVLKGIAFEITANDLECLWVKQQGKCAYSGLTMTMGRSERLHSFSIDRINNSKGYTLDNIVLCCSIINRMKQTLTPDEFVSICRNVVEYNNR